MAGFAPRRYPILGYPERFDFVRDLLFIVLFVAAWIVLQRWLLPLLGIRT